MEYPLSHKKVSLLRFHFCHAYKLQNHLCETELLGMKITKDKLKEIPHSNAATISKHKHSTVKSSRQQSNNSKIKQKIMVAGDSMLNNIHERMLCVEVKNFSRCNNRNYLKKMKNLLESKQDMLMVHTGTNDLPKNINPLSDFLKYIGNV